MTAFWSLLGVWPVVCIVGVCVAPRTRGWKRLAGLLVASVLLFVAGVAVVLRGDIGLGILLCGNALAGALATTVSNIILALGSAACEWRDQRPNS